MSCWQLIISKEALKALESIPKKQRDRLWSSIKRLAGDPYDSGLDVKPLKARPEWRLRVGCWRVIFRVEQDRLLIVVVAVAPRGDAYK